MSQTYVLPPGSFCEAATEYAAGHLWALCQMVMLGVKPAAQQTLRVDEQSALIEQVKRAYPGVLIATAAVDGTWVEVYIAKERWALDALLWLHQHRVTLDGHIHWIQGLLYGYGPHEIQEYVDRRSTNCVAGEPR